MRSLTRQAILPPAGRKKPAFFTKNLHTVQHACKKKKKGTMLPQANRGFIGANVRFEQAPRNSCYLKGIGPITTVPPCREWARHGTIAVRSYNR